MNLEVPQKAVICLQAERPFPSEEGLFSMELVHFPPDLRKLYYTGLCKNKYRLSEIYFTKNY
jgi:hypothetical protein